MEAPRWRSARVLAPTMVISGLFVVAGIAINGAHDDADRELQAGIELAQIRTGIAQIQAVEQDALAANRVGPQRKRALISARTRVEDGLGELSSLEQDDGDGASSLIVANRQAKYAGAVSAELGLISDDRQRAARTFSGQRTEPAFTNLRSAVDSAQLTEAAEAAGADTTASRGTIATLAAAALALLALAIGFDRRSRRTVSELDQIAHHDTLTGLPNRRRMLTDLERALEVRDPDAQLVVAMFDLDGFKLYNDTFGHAEGDLLLARLGARLKETVAEAGTAYRVGGDTFSAIVSCDEPSCRELISRCASALTEAGPRFEVRTSHGHVVIPDDAREIEPALRCADERLYAHKESRQSEAIRGHTRDLVLEIIKERDPALQEHLGGVSDLAAAVGRRMGLDDRQVADLVRAAEFHDIGKIAIPESILHKPSPLSSDERGFMLRHTLIGERMLDAVPALEPVARIVRSCHERHDGHGYPDGLRGREIPLASMIVFVCDAFDAMTSDRPYRAAMSDNEALAELRDAAGSQFDPAVVEAFITEYRTSRATPNLRLAHPRLERAAETF